MHIKPFAAALALPLALAACGSETPEPQPTEAADAKAVSDAPAGVSLTDAQVRLPAATGRPGVAYFTVASDDPRSIVGVSVMGAGSSEMHETKMVDSAMTMTKVDEVTLQPGEPITFQSGGYHVMLFGVDPTLAIGGTTDLTITFDNGDKASITAQIVGPGGMTMDDDTGGNHDMAGMEH